MKKLSICLGLLFIFGIGNFAMAQNNEVKKSVKIKKNHIEILWDYKEFIFLENGKEVQRKRIEKNSDDEKIAFDSVQKKVFHKLGVSSKKELTQKKLWPKYNEEISKRLKVISLAAKEPNRVRFINGNGNIVREIKLDEEIVTRTVGEIKAEWKYRDLGLKNQVNSIRHFFSFGKSEANKEKRLRKVKFVSTNKPKNYAALAVTEDILTSVGPVIGFSNLVYLDSDGKELWTHKFSQRRSILAVGSSADAPQISDNGEFVTAMTGEGTGGGYQLHVFNRAGDEVFIYPSNKDFGNVPQPSNHKISSDGTYLSYEIYFKDIPKLSNAASGIVKDVEAQKNELLKKINKRIRTVFWNLRNKTTWETERYYVYWISPEGTAKIESYGPLKMTSSKIIDLKPNLRKP